jgi:hypothetical protein
VFVDQLLHPMLAHEHEVAQAGHHARTLRSCSRTCAAHTAPQTAANTQARDCRKHTGSLLLLQDLQKQTAIVALLITTMHMTRMHTAVQQAVCS